MDKEGKDKAMARLRKRGIRKENKRRADAGRTDFIRERERSDNKAELRICPICEGFYSRSYMTRHKKRCACVPLDRYLKSMPVSSLKHDCSLDNSEFRTVVLDSFQEGPTGDLCRSDWMIKTVGLHQFQRKKNKVTSMTDMRRLAHLLRYSYEVTSESGTKLQGVDLLHRKNYSILMQAVLRYTNRGGKHKPNLLVALSYLLRNAANIIMAEYLEVMRDDEALELEKFLHVLKIRWQVLTSAAIEAQQLRSQEVLRKPIELPLEEDLIKFRAYVMNRIESLVKNSDRGWELCEFTELRDLLSARLTLFNARRGSEAARMFLRQYHDAVGQAWIDPRVCQQLEQADRLLGGKYKLGYMLGYLKGKGRTDVPVLFPEDTVEAVGVLVKVRPQFETSLQVRPDNPYLFPTTKGSIGHVVGNYSLQRVCRDAGINDPDRIAGGKNRVNRIFDEFSTLICD